MYRARVERHSVTPKGVEAASLVIEFPRVVLAETVTHRANKDTWGECEVSWCERTTTADVSKNSGSSRAIPLARMIKKVFDDPYVPERWSKAGPGMSEAGWLEGEDHQRATTQWLYARNDAVRRAASMLSSEDRGKLSDSLAGLAKDLVDSADHGPLASVHKQDVNRLLEPWLWVQQVATSSNWSNFFALRCHRAAHPAFRHVARMMYLAIRNSVPDRLEYGQWHLPFVPREEALAFRWQPDHRVCLREVSAASALPTPVRHSAARCAWVSYHNHDRDASPEAHERTFATLIGGFPVHASPIEHQLTPMSDWWESRYPHLRSNVAGWLQARKLVPLENAPAFEPSDEEVASWCIDESSLWPAEDPS